MSELPTAYSELLILQSGIKLSCGKHFCPEKCHQVVDHTKQACHEKVETQCTNKHRVVRECWLRSQPCPKCERDAQLQQSRQKAQDDYLDRLIAIEDKIAVQRAIVQSLDEEVVRAATLKQKQDDLVAATRNARLRTQSHATPQAPKQATDQAQPQQAPLAPAKSAEKVNNARNDTSEAAQSWQHQKKYENAQNEDIDGIMGMIGLESVKQQILNVKDKVDTSLRQGASLSKERFNVLLLGNPGTGKYHNRH